MREQGAVTMHDEQHTPLPLAALELGKPYLWVRDRMFRGELVGHRAGSRWMVTTASVKQLAAQLRRGA